MSEPRRLASSTSPEVAAQGGVLLVPLGSTEQHGPHLPVDTDTRIAVAVCERVARDRAEVCVAPAVAYGSSGEHAGFAGTLSIGQEALELVVLELVRSAGPEWRAIVLVNGHGGNSDALSRALRTLQHEARPVTAWSPTFSGGDTHAGATETSMMLALDPDCVRRDEIVVGDTRPLAELMPALRDGGLRAVTANGVLGDPRSATAAEGERLLDSLAASLGVVVDGQLRLVPDGDATAGATAPTPITVGASTASGPSGADRSGRR